MQPGKWYAVHLGSYHNPDLPVQMSGDGMLYTALPVAVGRLVLSVRPRLPGKQVTFYASLGDTTELKASSNLGVLIEPDLVDIPSESWPAALVAGTVGPALGLGIAVYVLLRCKRGREMRLKEAAGGQSAGDVPPSGSREVASSALRTPPSMGGALAADPPPPPSAPVGSEWAQPPPAQFDGGNGAPRKDEQVIV